MKTLSKLFLVTLLLVTAVSCSKFDDSAIQDRLDEHENRLAYLEEVCKKINSSLLNLQSIVSALENDDYIVDAFPLATGDGYTFIFKSGKSVVINHGKDGADGKDGATPLISVKKDVDGIYYWTINGEWIIVDGEKMKASGCPGNDGAPGKDGITPQIKIENDYWYVSYDQGASWQPLGKVTAGSGLVGPNGSAFFKGVTLAEGYVVFTLNDGQDTQIRVPYRSNAHLTIHLAEPGTLKNQVPLEQQRTLHTLKITGEYNKKDLIFINCYLTSLETLDLSDATFIDIDRDYNYPTPLNPLNDSGENRTIRHILFGSYKADNMYDPTMLTVDPSHFLLLETLTLTVNRTCIEEYAVDEISYNPKRVEVFGSPNLTRLVIAEGVTELSTGTAYRDETYCVCPEVEFPSTLKKVGTKLFGYHNASTIICHAITPPEMGGKFDDPYGQMKFMTLQVPAESVDVYRTTPGWSQFGTILPIQK